MTHMKSQGFGGDKGSQVLSKASSKAPESVETKVRHVPSPQIEQLLAKAVKFVDTGDSREAIKIINDVLKIEPNNELALVEMGMILLIDMKSPHKARSYFERALTVNPNNKVVLSELIGIYDEMHEKDKGLAFLEKLWQERDDSPSLALGIGHILASNKDLEKAIPYFERSVEMEASESVLTDLADLYSETNQDAKAVDAYQRVADLAQEKFDSGFYTNNTELGRENLASAYMDLISELVKQKRLQEAEEIMESKIKIIYDGKMGELVNILERSRSYQR